VFEQNDAVTEDQLSFSIAAFDIIFGVTRLLRPTCKRVKIYGHDYAIDFDHEETSDIVASITFKNQICKSVRFDRR
jgi:hypothetical protein